MSPEAALRSDHVNLLIHRYLQESGFETAAKAFHVDWQRRPEYRDPESLPFAHTLQRNELISVVQAGLHYDDLRARASKTDRKFLWTTTVGRERAGAYIENGAGSRPTSSGRRKGHPHMARASDDFPTPMPKRQRRSDGSDSHVNGERDIADVDAVDAEANGDVEGEEDADAVSAAGFSEPEAVSVERYDSVMTQTEFKQIPKTNSISWTIEKPGARLLEGSWNLGPEPRHARTLLAVGESLCRLYELPDCVDDHLEIKSRDDPILSDGSLVTAVAWRPDGEATSFAMHGPTDSEEETQNALPSLIERGRDGSIGVFLLAPALEPAGIVLSLRYSPTGEYLLAASSNTKRGLVQVWNTSRPEHSELNTALEPIAWKMFENLILDIVWTDHDTFVACGDTGSSLHYQVDSNQHQASEAQVTGKTDVRGLISLNSNILPAEHAWDYVRVDKRHRFTAFASIEARKLVLTSRVHSPEIATGSDLEIMVPGTLSALELQPLPITVDYDADAQIPSLLAVATEEGPCCIYSISRQMDGTLQYAVGHSLSLAEGQIMTLAWSLRGDYLAVGNAGLVQIWHINALKRTDGATNQAPDAYVTWRPTLEAHGPENEQFDDESELCEPSLRWSADDSLAYAVNKQIAILRFQVHQPEMNGKSSPAH